MKTENEIPNARNCQMNNNIDFNYEKSSKNGNSESLKIPGRKNVENDQNKNSPLSDRKSILSDAEKQELPPLEKAERGFIDSPMRLNELDFSIFQEHPAARNLDGKELCEMFFIMNKLKLENKNTSSEEIMNALKERFDGDFLKIGKSYEMIYLAKKQKVLVPKVKSQHNSTSTASNQNFTSNSNQLSVKKSFESTEFDPYCFECQNKTLIDSFSSNQKIQLKKSAKFFHCCKTCKHTFCLPCYYKKYPARMAEASVQNCPFCYFTNPSKNALVKRKSGIGADTNLDQTRALKLLLRDLLENSTFKDVIENGIVPSLNSKSPFNRFFVRNSYNFDDLKTDLESKKVKTPGQFMMYFKQILHNYKIVGDLDKHISGYEDTRFNHGSMLTPMTRKVSESLKTISRCGECFTNSNNTKKPCSVPHQLVIVKNITVMDEKLIKLSTKKSKNRESSKREKKSSWPGKVLRSIGVGLIEVQLLGYHDQATSTRIVKSSQVELVLSNKDIPTSESIGDYGQALFLLRTMVESVDEELKKNVQFQKGFRKTLDTEVSLLYENIGRVMKEAGESPAQTYVRQITSSAVPDNPEIFEQFEKTCKDNLLPQFQIMTQHYANHTKKVFNDFSTKITTKHDTEFFKQKYLMDNKPINNPKCEACGSQENEDSKMYTCGNCRTAKYCRQECQTEDWKKGHYKICFGGNRNKTNRRKSDKIE